MRQFFASILLGILGGFTAIWIPFSSLSHASDFVVYSIYRGLSLGNDEAPPQKDYYINMGTAEGIHKGSVLQVYRQASTYDVVSEQLYRDIAFPIATVKVIHAEPKASIARMHKLLSPDSTPSMTTRAVMVGDLVRIAELPAEPVSEPAPKAAVEVITPATPKITQVSASLSQPSAPPVSSSSSVQPSIQQLPNEQFSTSASQ